MVDKNGKVKFFVEIHGMKSSMTILLSLWMNRQEKDKEYLKIDSIVSDFVNINNHVFDKFISSWIVVTHCF